MNFKIKMLVQIVLTYCKQALILPMNKVAKIKAVDFMLVVFKNKKPISKEMGFFYYIRVKGLT